MDRESLLAVVSLTAHLTSSPTGVSPLGPQEWDQAARTIHEQNLLPRDLLNGSADLLLTAMEEAHQKLKRPRMEALLQRQHLASRQMDAWLRDNIQLLGRRDVCYPAAFRHHLKSSTPPLLYGAGNMNLLLKPGVAIVGSRDAEYEALRKATDLGAEVAAAGFTVISGGARGIDERAVEGALMANGSAVIMLPDSLAKQALKHQFRKYLDSEHLALISPYAPDAGYRTGTAMGRNRLIYCLADAALVVRSVRHSGGTFAGAKQALEGQWTQVWVLPSDDIATGNRALHDDHGAHWLPESDLTPVWESIRRTPEPEDHVDDTSALVMATSHRIQESTPAWE